MVDVEVLGPAFSTFVRSVLLACEEKGISYQCGMEYNGQPVAMHSEEHFRLHPFGKVPVLLHQGQVICETPTILRYLDQLFPQAPLQPDTADRRAQVDQWCNFISQYCDQQIVRRFLLEFVFPKGEGGSVRIERVEAAVPELQKVLAKLEQQLGQQDFICGSSFSMADVLLLPMLDYLLNLPQGAEQIQKYPALVAYVVRLRQRDSAKKVLNL